MTDFVMIEDGRTRQACRPFPLPRAAAGAGTKPEIDPYFHTLQDRQAAEANGDFELIKAAAIRTGIKWPPRNRKDRRALLADMRREGINR